MYRVFEHSQVVLSGFQCIWTTPANLKIQLKPSMSEIRNYCQSNIYTFHVWKYFWNWNLFFDKSFLKQARKYFLEIFASEIAVCNHTIPIISHLSSIQCESLSRWNRNFALLFSPAVPFILFYLGLRENHPASCQLSNRDLPSFISTSRPEF